MKCLLSIIPNPTQLALSIYWKQTSGERARFRSVTTHEFSSPLVCLARAGTCLHGLR